MKIEIYKNLYFPGYEEAELYKTIYFGGYWEIKSRISLPGKVIYWQ